jgi:hypothetical protein
MTNDNKLSKIITLEEYNNNKLKSKKPFYYINDIKNTLKKYDIFKHGKKKELEFKLITFFEHLNIYSKYTTQISIIQQNIRHYLTKIKIKNQGIGILYKSKCKNQEDFYTLDNLNDIDEKYFFSYESNNHIYYFDIRSFKKLLKLDGKNPYTREEIPKYAIHSFNNRLLYCNKHNILLENDIEPQLTEQQIFNNKTLDLFQKIDLLDVTAGGTNHTWFTNLNLLELKILYKTLEDIWNYRAELTHTKKHDIVKNNPMFSISIKDVYNIKNKRQLQYILLDEMNTLISTADSNDDRITGSYFILTALVEISPTCMNALPWLIQHS